MKMDHIRACFQEQCRILQQIIVHEVLLRRKEVHFIFLDEIVLDGGNHRHTKKGIFTVHTTVEAFLLWLVADIFGLERQGVYEGILYA